ncbi:MAG TPA: phytoene/squalene synthase family protein [Planctomycetaceae bacterium]|nr:phytoene/squalene synthase family protein [Planctomycetaceae bacterium]
MLGMIFETPAQPVRATAQPATVELGAWTPQLIREPFAGMLRASYRWARECTQASRSNFYYSLLALPRPLFRDMCALYAYMRVSDDLGDDWGLSVEDRAASLARWRVDVDQALEGAGFRHPVLPALADVVARHRIPREYLFAVIDGVQMDLESTGFEQFSELSNYCFHVAGAVGLCCLHIWGFDSAEALALAVDCGRSFQLTNILRDVAEDARVGRCYLPREDLRRFGLSEADLRTTHIDPRLRNLIAFEAQRARTDFARARRLIPLCRPCGRPILDAMIRTYGALLDAIEARDYDVFSHRVALGHWKKMAIVSASVLRHHARRWLGGDRG